jgi:hypothetical protein
MMPVLWKKESAWANPWRNLAALQTCDKRWQQQELKAVRKQELLQAQLQLNSGDIWRRGFSDQQT